MAARTSSSVERALWMRRLARKDDVVERGDRCDHAGEVGSTLRGLRGETCCSTPGEGANLLMRRHWHTSLQAYSSSCTARVSSVMHRHAYMVLYSRVPVPVPVCTIKRSYRTGTGTYCLCRERLVE